MDGYVKFPTNDAYFIGKGKTISACILSSMDLQAIVRTEVHGKNFDCIKIVRKQGNRFAGLFYVKTFRIGLYAGRSVISIEIA